MKSIPTQTSVTLPPSERTFDYSNPMLTLGSCFAGVLGTQLEGAKFPVLNNPLGTIFNPYSLAKLLTMALDGNAPKDELFVRNRDGLWMHYDFHSSFWATSRGELEEKIGAALARVRNYLRSADALVVTFGTAYVYRYKKDLSLVSNCHKAPQSEFKKELLGYDHLVNVWGRLIRSLSRSLSIVLTVSPVRHTRDTLPLNQVSKSVLRLLCHRLSEQHPQVSYFPSYELMLDELRDYRYYREDLIHPSPLAERIIFRRFADHYLTEEARTTMGDWESVRKMLAHRPLHGPTPSYLSHLETTLQKLEVLSGTLAVGPEVLSVRREIGEVAQALTQRQG